MTTKKEINDYLKRNPDLLKWVNSCSLCGAIGYKLNMPKFDETGHVGFKNLRTFLQPLEVNENGICMQCAKFIK